MDFSLSDDEQLLADTAADLASKRFGSAVARRVIDGAESPFGDAWAELVHLGWAGLLVPEEHGGAGASILDVALVVEALARHLAPVPMLGTALASAAVRLLARGDERAELLEHLARGEAYVLVLDGGLQWPPLESGAAYAWEWWGRGTPLVSTGGALSAAGHTAVAALGWHQDPLHPLGSLSLASPAGSPLDPDAVRRFGAIADVLVSAALVGIMAGVTDLSVAYAAGREQFGQPIGAFQAVQHLCADMLVDTESSRSITWAAAWAADNEASLDEVERLAATAKAWCADVSLGVCESATQVHGGMGITWDCDVHLYLRQAHLLGRAFRDRSRATDVALDHLVRLASEPLA